VVSQGDRLEDDWVYQEDNRPAEEIEKESAAAEGKSRWGWGCNHH
jgi:hypothetical protein